MTQSAALPLPPPKERRRLREAASLTQAQLARRVGVTRETVRAWESGRSNPRGRKRDAYAKLLRTLAEEHGTAAGSPTAAHDSSSGVELPERHLSAPGSGAPSAGRPGAGGGVSGTRRPKASARGGSSAREGSPARGGSSALKGVPACGESAGREASSAGRGSAEKAARETVAVSAAGAGRGDRAGGGDRAGRGNGDGGGALPGTVKAEASGGAEAGLSGAGPTEAGVSGAGSSAGRDSGAGEAAPGRAPLTPAQAFDALYGYCAPALVRQTYLLTGRRELAREAVERAFQLAWQRWPEVAVDPDPAGWVRAAAYEYALSPWHRFRPRYRHPEPPPADPADRALLDALLTLPAPYRRTLLLYDGLGLDLPDTAAETEASTPATAGRLLHAREAVAERIPELADPAVLRRRLTELASAERLRAARPPVVRDGGERRARLWTRAAIAFTVLLIGTTALTLRTAPTHYEPPIAPGAEIEGVPPRVAQGPLSKAEAQLRDKLRRELTSGPSRLAPLER